MARKAKRYSCAICNKTFAHPGLVAKHYRTAHPDRFKKGRLIHGSSKRNGTQKGAQEQRLTAALDFRTAYAFGKVESFLEIYADSHGLSKRDLADSVGRLLQGPQVR